MTRAADEYRLLEDRRLALRQLGALTPELEDSILERLDDLWWDMDPSEQADANRRAEMAARRIRTNSAVSWHVRLAPHDQTFAGSGVVGSDRRCPDAATESWSLTALFVGAQMASRPCLTTSVSETRTRRVEHHPDHP